MKEISIDTESPTMDPTAGIEENILDIVLAGEQERSLKRELRDDIDFQDPSQAFVFLTSLPHILETYSRETGNAVPSQLVEMSRGLYRDNITSLLDVPESPGDQEQYFHLAKQNFNLALALLEAADKSNLEIVAGVTKGRILQKGFDYAQRAFESVEYAIAEDFLLKVRNHATPGQLRDLGATRLAGELIQDLSELARESMEENYASAVCATYNIERFANAFGVRVPRKAKKIRRQAYKLGFGKVAYHIESALENENFVHALLYLDSAYRLFPQDPDGVGEDSVWKIAWKVFSSIDVMDALKRVWLQHKIWKGLKSKGITSFDESSYTKDDVEAVEETLKASGIPLEPLETRLDSLTNTKVQFIRKLSPNDFHSSEIELREIEAYQDGFQEWVSGVRAQDRFHSLLDQFGLLNKFLEEGKYTLAETLYSILEESLGRAPVDEDPKLERIAISLDYVDVARLEGNKHLDDKLAEKLKAQSECAETDPQYHQIKLDTIGLYAARGRPDEVLAILSSSKDLADNTPDSSLLHYFHGYSLLQIGDVNRAVAAFEKAVELSPNTGTRYALACALAQKGDVAGAKAQVESVLESEPDNENALDLQANLDDDETAEDYIRIAELRGVYRINQLRELVTRPLSYEITPLLKPDCVASFEKDLAHYMNELVADGSIDIQRLADWMLTKSEPTASADESQLRADFESFSTGLLLYRDSRYFTPSCVEPDYDLDGLMAEVDIQDVAASIPSSGVDYGPFLSQVAAYALDIYNRGTDPASPQFLGKLKDIVYQGVHPHSGDQAESDSMAMDIALKIQDGVLLIKIRDDAYGPDDQNEYSIYGDSKRIYSQYSSDDELHEAASQLYRDGAWLGSVRLFEALKARSPDHPYLDYDMGYALLKNGDLEDALHCLERAAQKHPEDTGLSSDIAYITTKMPQPSEEVTDVAQPSEEVTDVTQPSEEAPAQPAANFDTSYEQAYSLLKSGDFGGAAEHFKALVGLKPDDTWLRSDYAATLVKTGQPDAAKAEAQAAYDLDNTNTDAKELLGL
ncbi:tetratricopeptide repeat protein [Candidatus Woesearchaeota archaeon]|nr:tetratricopeptide repeat protein [Candidatus Woesearchaeota archaeon]